MRRGDLAQCYRSASLIVACAIRDGVDPVAELRSLSEVRYLAHVSEAYRAAAVIVACAIRDGLDPVEELRRIADSIEARQVKERV